MTIKKVCGVCENEFWTRGNRAKYCSPECRKLVNSLRVSETLNSKQGKSGTKKLLIQKKPFLNMGKHCSGSSTLLTSDLLLK